MMSLHETVLRWWDGGLGGSGAALDVLTAPAELLYRGITGTRNALYDAGTLKSERLTVPVISIGNIAIGGTGKTPVTAWLARTLRDDGGRPAILHGGYAPDEPALHARLNPDIPVFAARDRVASGTLAITRGATVLVLDDAFQHRRLKRDLDIVLIAAETWNQPRRTLPRGPWREPSSALRRADHIVVTRRTADLECARAVMADAGRTSPNVTIVALRATVWRRGDHAFAGVSAASAENADAGSTDAAPAGSALLVCGIAAPHAFAKNARAAGAVLSGTALFPDHHEYGAGDAANILERAGNDAIVTTAKDWIKLATLLPPERVWILHQTVVPEDGADALLAAVRAVLS